MCKTAEIAGIQKQVLKGQYSLGDSYPQSSQFSFSIS
jgi:hypothetical protein